MPLLKNLAKFSEEKACAGVFLVKLQALGCLNICTSIFPANIYFFIKSTVKTLEKGVNYVQI